MARSLMVSFVIILGMSQIKSITTLPRSHGHNQLTVNRGTSFLSRTPPLKRLSLKLYSKTSMFLQIENNGGVRGTPHCTPETVSRMTKFLGNVKMELISVGSGIKLIRGVSSERYLAMNRNGMVYSTPMSNQETLFFEVALSNGLSTFASLKYYRRVKCDTFLAVSRNGTMIPGTKSNKYQDSSQFFEIPSFICPDINA